MLSGCVGCGREMAASDSGRDGTQVSCRRCRRRWRRQDEILRGLVAQAHKEGRMPPALRRVPRSRIDLALDAVGDSPAAS